MYVIRNGIIVQPDRLLFGYELVVVDDRIEAIQRQGTLDAEGAGAGIIDAHGGYVVPGLIDIHSDYIETVISPRPTVLMDFPTALFEAERELIAHGITTMFHSLSVYGADKMDVKPVRQWDRTEQLMALISRAKHTEGRNAHLIRHRLHLRLEIDNIGLVEQVEKHLRAGEIDELSFMDHTPGQGQYRDMEIWRKSFRGNLTEEEAARLAADAQAAPKMSYEQLSYLAGIAREQGIALASHDDDTIEKLDLMRELGCTISEFPISQDIAAAAVERGMSTVMGTPNILLGKSHSGNLSARDAVRAGVASCLCSDYYPTAMLQSAFVLHRDFKLPLEQAFAMLTINPARAVKIDDELGSLEEGKKADILVVREVEEGQRSYPVITATLVDGRVVSRMWYPALPSMSARFAVDAATLEETVTEMEVR
ncbi:alpha-D-ribose 1-methylphosphonate 5-triphosphate diphosphatase [Collinsella tanakaei]|uniref:alpha-D-ribose 1-methylphosphonate 5-triphosphate diphosphatase n=1 Tax=Collinsella tanakaei TaxID=626935 RepID=UPI0019569B6C|nr:alpha-D-ribose 1-methylphosphonate 5-triphosphate diphosphatase [Collinsella tanakaei]MBM6778991.1 alpha-D-ribose 1-methylphosphonate 5-triphosphate diphosphatase [Collinsella tanakaei]